MHQRSHPRHRLGASAGVRRLRASKPIRRGTDQPAAGAAGHFPEERSIKKLLVAGAIALGAISAQAKDIVDTAVGAGSFTTLVTALKAAGLVATSKGKSPFTVFALADAAFVKIPKADPNGLSMDRGKLTAVPSYHVVSAEIQSKDLEPDKV